VSAVLSWSADIGCKQENNAQWFVCMCAYTMEQTCARLVCLYVVANVAMLTYGGLCVCLCVCVCMCVCVCVSACA
jgi:hypothetical protein